MTTTEQTTSTIRNDLHIIGANAVKAWNTSDREGAKGDALATYVLSQAFNVTVFRAEIKNANGEVEHARTFMLKNMKDEPRTEDGAIWRAMQTARNVAILKTLFQHDDNPPSAAMKTRLNRCLQLAANIMAQPNVTSDDVTLSKGNNLRVPMRVMIDAPDADKAKESVVERFERDADKPFVLDGTKDRTLAALKRRVTPTAAKRQGNGDASKDQDKPKAFDASLSFVLACVQSFNGKDGESDIAPTKDIDAKLHDLKASLDAYFADADKPAQRKRSNDTRASK